MLFKKSGPLTIFTPTPLRMPFSSNVDAKDPIDQQPTIGIIGMGLMGSMYTNRLSAAGWKKFVA